MLIESLIEFALLFLLFLFKKKRDGYRGVGGDKWDEEGGREG